MVRELITLPLRLGLFAAGVAMSVSRQAVRLALSVPGRLTEAAPAPGPDDVVADGEHSANGLRVDVFVAAPAATTANPPATSAASDREPVPQAEPSEVMPEVAPAHVTEEPELVESFAEPGAEESVGAAVHVDEPWDGYRQMSARDVIARLAEASPEELAAVTLYETGHRARRTVLAAADRRLRRATAAGRQRA